MTGQIHIKVVAIMALGVHVVHAWRLRLLRRLARARRSRRPSDDGALFDGVGCDRGCSGAVTAGSGPAVAADELELGRFDVCSAQLGSRRARRVRLEAAAAVATCSRSALASSTFRLSDDGAVFDSVDGARLCGGWRRSGDPSAG